MSRLRRKIENEIIVVTDNKTNEFALPLLNPIFIRYRRF